MVQPVSPVFFFTVGTVCRGTASVLPPDNCYEGEKTKRNNMYPHARFIVYSSYVSLDCVFPRLFPISPQFICFSSASFSTAACPFSCLPDACLPPARPNTRFSELPTCSPNLLAQHLVHRASGRDNTIYRASDEELSKGRE